MGSADGDEHAGFADLQAAEAMNDGHAIDGEFLVEQLADFAHFGEGHGFIGFVVEIQGAAAMGLVANETVEGDDGTVGVGAHLADDSGCVNRRAKEGEQVILCDGVWHGWVSTSAYGRKKGDRIIFGEWRVPGGEFFVPGSDEGDAICGKIREATGVAVEQFCDVRAFENLHGFLANSGEFAQGAEEENFDAKIA